MIPPLVLLASAVLAQSLPGPGAKVAAPAEAVFANAPDWIRRPSLAEKLAAYPEGARLRRVSGQATLDCRLDADGRLTGCNVIIEAPAGYGFGQAALSLAPRFQMTPFTADGGSVEGSRVSIPIQFAPARTPRALRLR